MAQQWTALTARAEDPHDSLQPSTTSVPGHLTPPGLPGHRALTWHTDIYAAKIPIYIILIISNKNK